MKTVSTNFPQPSVPARVHNPNNPHPSSLVDPNKPYNSVTNPVKPGWVPDAQLDETELESKRTTDPTETDASVGRRIANTVNEGDTRRTDPNDHRVPAKSQFPVQPQFPDKYPNKQ